MTPPTDPSRPRLIVVTGRPGAGKTTLAHRLARELRCLAVCRDEIREGYATKAGESDDAISRHVYETFFATLRMLLERRVSVVAEAAFQHKLWATPLTRLRDLADVRIVICDVPPAVALSRLNERLNADPRRREFHRDAELGAALIKAYEPPAFDVPTLVVDTASEYFASVAEIVRFARGAVRP